MYVLCTDFLIYLWAHVRRPFQCCSDILATVCQVASIIHSTVEASSQHAGLTHIVYCPAAAV